MTMTSSLLNSALHSVNQALNILDPLIDKKPVNDTFWLLVKAKEELEGLIERDKDH